MTFVYFSAVLVPELFVSILENRNADVFVVDQMSTLYFSHSTNAFPPAFRMDGHSGSYCKLRNMIE